MVWIDLQLIVGFIGYFHYFSITSNPRSLLLIPLLTRSKGLSITQSNQAGIIYFSLRLGDKIETVRK